MIKLTDLLESVYTDKPEGPDDALMQQGFKLGKPEIDPETGTSSTTVTYLPKFEELRRQILMMRKEFQAFYFSSNEDISKISREINKNLKKSSELIFALDKMIELQRKG
jgi:hypothetical protein